MTTTTTPAATDRDQAIASIRKALRTRTGRTWSVTGGRGTVWGWITITAPPKRRERYGEMSDTDRADLAKTLGLDLNMVRSQGVEIPSGSDYRREYVDRAEGRTPTVHGKPYWD